MKRCLSPLLRVLSLAVFIVLLFAIQGKLDEVCADTYYVSLNGDDYGDGTAEFPWATIKKALRTVKCGDFVNISEGRFSEGTLSFEKGTCVGGESISITGLGPNKTIIDHAGVRNGWILKNRSDVRISNLSITNSDEGLVIVGNSARNKFQNLFFYNIKNRGVFAVGYSTKSYPKECIIENCTFENIGIDTIGADISLSKYVTNFLIQNNVLNGNVDGIVMSEASSGNVVNSNRIMFHKMEDGIDIKNTKKSTPDANMEYNLIIDNIIMGHENQTGVTVQKGSIGVVVMSNLIYGNKWGVWVNDEGTGDVVIKNNEVVKNKVSGIIVNQNADGPVVITENYIENNGKTPGLQKGAGVTIDSGVGCKIEKNIFSNNGESIPGGGRHVYWNLKIPPFLIGGNRYYDLRGDKVIQINTSYFDVGSFERVYGVTLKSNFSPTVIKRAIEGVP